MSSPMHRFNARIEGNQEFESRGVPSDKLQQARTYASRLFQQLNLVEQETVVDDDQTFKKVMDLMLKIYSSPDTSTSGFEGEEGDPLRVYQIDDREALLQIMVKEAVLHALKMDHQQNKQ